MCGISKLLNKSLLATTVAQLNQKLTRKPIFAMKPCPLWETHKVQSKYV